MRTKEEMEQAAKQAILALRKAKLEQGHPFMINTSALPPGQCYLEYPDGTIEIVTLSKSRMDFERVRLLSRGESVELLKLLDLL